MYTDPLGLNSVGGHYYTVLVVSLAAGYSMDEAKELAFFAQYPDYVKEYEAWDLIEGDRSAPRIAAHKSKEWVKVGKSLSENALLKQSIGHSFRNSDPVPYRKSYAQNWSSLGGLHEKGMVLHFFADLYAHAYDQEDGTERLVDTGLGHATKGTGPDYIGLDHAKYDKYVRDMYAMIKKDGSNDGMIEGLLAFTKTFSVPNKHRTYYSYDASAGKLSAENLRFFDGSKENDSMRAFAQRTLARRGATLPTFDPSKTIELLDVFKGTTKDYGIQNHNDLLDERRYLQLLREVGKW
jgi:hypothetical protein